MRIIVPFLVLLLPATAQEFNDDARLWLYLKLDKDLSKKWNAHLLLQNRFNNNVTEYSRGYSDFGVTYKINKHVRVMADYVYGRSRRPDDSYSHVHQAYTGVILRHKIGQLLLVYRLLLQAQVKDIYASDKGGVPKLYVRNKLTMKYEITKRVNVFVAEELNNRLLKSEEDRLPFSRSRSFVGAGYNLTKTSSIEAYFLFQRKFKLENQPARDFIYGITYSYSF